MTHNLGVAASGSPEVSQTAVEILEAGGNVFDAALGALCTAIIAEPLLASLGGGGFLLAMPGSGSPLVYDFFCQTPAKARPQKEIDFYPIMADFGTALQEFHIGMGSMAVPGGSAAVVFLWDCWWEPGLLGGSSPLRNPLPHWLHLLRLPPRPILKIRPPRRSLSGWTRSACP